ncbi:glycine zipper 2TM domain-containing protein [Massilia glaciei]|uniref:Glycine zipper 2TM domain-containing protein n=2 Tax=Massilia glaciei TaxID=1524097 RepID=A0A2U2HEF2_9BURK|nr:glycine zipper 2TM domain-containing protein [Massilia glaciei]
MIAAAIAVLIFCLVGTAAIMGWLPSSKGNNGGELTAADRGALASDSRQLQQPQQQLLAQNTQAPHQAQPQPRYEEAPRTQYAPKPAPKPAKPLRNTPVQLAAAEPVRNSCRNCGNIESIRAIKTRAQGSGVGAVGGALLGGLLGNQVGGGSGKKVATVAGVVGGAMIGNQVEGNMKATTRYEIRVRLDDGSSRTFNQDAAPAWGDGDRVRIVDGAIRSLR